MHFCPSASDIDTADSALFLSSEKTTSAEDIFNSAKFQNIRKTFLNGQFPKECSACKNVEENSGKSFRQVINEGLGRYIVKADLISKTDQNGHLSAPQLLYLELRLGRVCNLRCRFCNPTNSTSWDQDYIKLYGQQLTSVAKSNNSSMDWHESDWFMKWFESVLPTLMTIQFAGGEPFLSSSHNRVLAKIIQMGCAEKMSLVYVTNGTIVDRLPLEAWKKFGKIIVFVSIEGTGGVYEYQRWPAKWKETENNLLFFKSQAEKGLLSLVIQPHVNIYNIATISELAIWCINQGENVQWNRHLNFLTEPAWQSAYILNPDQKIQVLKKIISDRSYIEKQYPRTQKVSDILYWLSSVEKILTTKDWSHLKLTFNDMNKKLDGIRNNNPRHYLDELTTSFLCDQS